MGQLTDLPAKGDGTAMGAFGDRLRREREMRGITLDEISESTKISRRHLEALEGEHFDQLPGGVFNKGFVRAYAHFLGIDEDQAVADYSAASNEQPQPEKKAAEKKFFIVVKAKEDSWISIVADGHSVISGRVLSADRQKLVKAARQIVLRTGNAGGIEVSFNGKSLGALGNENEPRTLTFSATGLVQ